MFYIPKVVRIILGIWISILVHFGAFSQEKIPNGGTIQEWADANELSNPVALSMDLESGDAWISEAHRKNTGVWGVTFSRWWAMRDYLNSTLEQRLEMYSEYEHIIPETQLTSKADQLRWVPNQKKRTNGIRPEDWGQGFNGMLDGNAAGVLAWDGWVYFACIPKLYRTKINNDGKQVFEELADGFGVRVGVHGHDLHGLIPGLDGRIYFSIGDRGYDVRNEHGKRFHQSHSGAVFRCYPDGSELELYHAGLRNPQDLAFNETGDLFTVDNNMSGGDECRIIHIIAYSDSGWNANYQLARNFRTETKREQHPSNPWFLEKLWSKEKDTRLMWVHRPIGHLTRGPSGLTYLPKGLFPDEWENRFLISDFVGSPANSKILAFQLSQNKQTAEFELTETKEFISGLLSTDQSIGNDGALYIADFINGWTGTGQGKIHRLDFPDFRSNQKNTNIFKHRENWSEEEDANYIDKLEQKLINGDYEVRLLAQWKIAGLGTKGNHVFEHVLNSQSLSAVKIHALWGMRAVAKKSQNTDLLRLHLSNALDSESPELRNQALRILSDLKADWFQKKILKELKNASPRNQASALLAFSHHPSESMIHRILSSLDLDEILSDQVRRSYLVEVFKKFAEKRTPQSLIRLTNTYDHTIQLLSVLALRRLESPEIAHYLKSSNPTIHQEAIRAIHDLRIPNALQELADLFQTSEFQSLPQIHKRRVLNSKFILGRKQDYEDLILFVLDHLDKESELCNEILSCLSHWESPSPFDNVTWFSRPIPERSRHELEDSVRFKLAHRLRELSSPQNKIEKLNLDLLVQLSLATMSINKNLAIELVNKESIQEPTLTQVLNFLITSTEKLDQELFNDKLEAFDKLKVLNSLNKKVIQKSSFYREVWLSENKALTNWLIDQIKLAGQNIEAKKFIQAGIKLNQNVDYDTFHWAGKLASIVSQFPDSDLRMSWEKWIPEELGLWTYAQFHGDKTKGEYLFYNHVAQCIRCHRVNETGGEAGPKLNPLVKTQSTDKLLRSLLYPSESLSAGYGVVTITLNDNQKITGTFLHNDSENITLSIPSNGQVSHKVIPKDNYQNFEYLPSAMPPMGNILSIQEAQDIVAFLKNLK